MVTKKIGRATDQPPEPSSLHRVCIILAGMSTTKTLCRQTHTGSYHDRPGSPDKPGSATCGS